MALEYMHTKLITDKCSQLKQEWLRSKRKYSYTFLFFYAFKSHPHLIGQIFCFCFKIFLRRFVSGHSTSMERNRLILFRIHLVMYESPFEGNCISINVHSINVREKRYHFARRILLDICNTAHSVLMLRFLRTKKFPGIVSWLCIYQVMMFLAKQHKIINLINLILSYFITVPGAGHTDSMNMCKLRKVSYISIF